MGTRGFRTRTVGPAARVTGVVLALGVVLGACGSDADLEGSRPGGTPTPTDGAVVVVEPGELTFTAALTPFGACDAFLDHVRAEGAARVGPYGFGDGGWFWPMPRDGLAAAEDAATDGPVGAPAPGGDTATSGDMATGGDGDGGYSGTNVQVEGVDEADVVKTDGERIVVVSDGRLISIDLSGPDPVRRGSVQLPGGWDHQLFLAGDRALVVAQGDAAVVADLRTDAGLADTVPASWSPSTVVSEVDLSDPDAPAVLRTLYAEGSYLSARAIGTTVRLAMTSPPSALPFVYPSGPGAEDIATEANRRIVAESTLEDWLPDYTLDDRGTITEGRLVPCERIHRPAEFAGFDLLSVLTFDLAGPLGAGENTAVLASGQTVYASTGSVYVATTVWPTAVPFADDAAQELDERYETAIHKFDISAAGAASYLASGSVPGHLLNQFSLDEYEGRLRVAVTEGSPWWGAQDTSRSTVLVLEHQGDRLNVVGSVTDLGLGEQIHAVRFMGPQAYVVTFRQIDPFYVVDLAVPTAPRVAGELKIPGYSAYLHPIGDGLVLGVGQDGTDDGRILGSKVSLFDVSDPAAPRELSTWALPDGTSEVEWDHRAFTWWGPERVAIVPVTTWSSGFSGAVVLRVDGGSLVEAGRVSIVTEGQGPGDCRDVPRDQLSDKARELLGPGVVIQVCGDAQAGGRPGYGCDSFGADELARYVEELDLDPVQLAPGERVEVCWPSWGPEQIRRTLVVDDLLWSLSWNTLQANVLADPGTVVAVIGI